jgi:hypothetical protein
LPDFVLKPVYRLDIYCSRSTHLCHHSASFIW